MTPVTTLLGTLPPVVDYNKDHRCTSGKTVNEEFHSSRDKEHRKENSKKVYHNEDGQSWRWSIYVDYVDGGSGDRLL